MQKKFMRARKGASLTEYGIMVGLVSAVTVVAVSLLGDKVETAFSSATAEMVEVVDQAQDILDEVLAGPSPQSVCAQYGSYDLYGAGSGYQLSIETNLWNMQGNGTEATPEEVCIEWFDEEPSPEAPWAWEWSIPGDGEHNIIAYPEMVIGQKPHRGLGESAFAQPVDARNITLDFDYTQTRSAGARNNVAISMWLTNSTNSVASSISNEVMIWLDEDTVWPGGSLAEAGVIVDGRAWDLYATDNWSDISGVNDGTWAYYAFVPSNDAAITSGSIEVSAFLDELLGRGMISTEEYLPSIELGAELMEGAGRIEMRDFGARITDRP